MRWAVLIAFAAVTNLAHAQGQADMSIHAETEYKQADQRMTQIWNEVYAAMKVQDGQNTSRGGGFGFAATALDAQRKWLALRDEQCSVEMALFQGGSMAPMIGVQCKARMTKERSADLQALLNLSK